jgi:hypothetical protein
MRFDAEKRREELGPALRRFKLTVEVAHVAADGTLHIQFSDGASLAVPSLSDYEA